MQWIATTGSVWFETFFYLACIAISTRFGVIDSFLFISVLVCCSSFQLVLPLVRSGVRKNLPNCILPVCFVGIAPLLQISALPHQLV